MTYEQRERLAAVLYRHFQGEVEELDTHRLASKFGSYDDANHYTQRMFREAVGIIENGIAAIAAEAAP